MASSFVKTKTRKNWNRRTISLSIERTSGALRAEQLEEQIIRDFLVLKMKETEMQKNPLSEVHAPERTSEQIIGAEDKVVLVVGRS